MHNSLISGHSSYLKTLHRVKQDFYWQGMKSDIKNHIRCCEVCQRTKYVNSKSDGLLQHLSIPDRPWLDISMDFIEGLPKSHGQDVILVVVDRLTKFVHFFPLHHPFTVATVFAIFMKGVFKLHGMPKSIVSDRGAISLLPSRESCLDYRALNWQCLPLTIHKQMAKPRLLIEAWSNT